MSAMQWVRVMNTTGVQLRIMYDSTPLVFEPSGFPGSVMDLPKAAADYVRGQLLDQVTVIDADARAKSIVDIVQQELLYLANMSGDPEAVDFHMETFQDKKTGEDLPPRKIRNELKQPQTFKARLGAYQGLVGPGSLSFKGNNGEWTTNQNPAQVTIPGKLVLIPPYGRIEVTPGQFQTLMMRDMDRPEQYRGQLIRSRKESDFEPDFLDPWWTIDRTRSWLEMIPPGFNRVAGKNVIGKSEAEIAVANADKSEIEMAALLHKTRYDLCAAARMRAVDPQFPLPSRKEWETFVGRKEKAAK